MSAPESLENLRAAFGSITQAPYCSGATVLTPTMSSLFYTKTLRASNFLLRYFSCQNTYQSINFTAATDAQLASLAEACQRATFGLKDQDVLDETYRKAGKLDATDFACQFCPCASGVVDTVSESLALQKEGDNKSLHVELYKLNVYGPGSFFKAHVDTPRSETMVGTIVVVLPTVHKGGSLIIRHRGEEYVIDTAQAVNSQPKPHVAFVAFYSDVEHEVAVVQSGYRVTLTYNLYKKFVDTLLNDPTFLRGGGYLGFGLSHKYPFDSAWASTNSLASISDNLKGSDAKVKQVCEALGLHVVLRALYSEKEKSSNDHPCCIVDRFLDFGPDRGIDFDFEGQFLRYLVDYQGSHAVDPYGYKFDNWQKWKPEFQWIERKGHPIVWIRPSGENNRFESPFVAYGNESTLAHAYGNVCLVAVVGKASD